MDQGSPKPSLLSARHDLRIVRPDVHKCLDVTRQLRSDDSPACILIPLDLTVQVALTADGEKDTEVAEALERCTKRCFVGANQVWDSLGCLYVACGCVIT